MVDFTTFAGTYSTAKGIVIHLLEELEKIISV